MDNRRQIPVTKTEQCPYEHCLSLNVSPTGVVSGSGAKWSKNEKIPLISHFGYKCNDCGLVFTLFKA